MKSYWSSQLLLLVSSAAVIVGVLVGASLGNENAIGWGLPDTVAPVGKLFEFPLSKGPPDNGHATRRAESPAAPDEADGSGDVKTDEKRRDNQWVVSQVGLLNMFCILPIGLLEGL